MKAIFSVLFTFIMVLSSIGHAAHGNDRKNQSLQNKLEDYVPDFIKDNIGDWLRFRPRQIVITNKQYTFEESFDIDSDRGHLGSVIQSSLSFRKNYSYFDHSGNLLSTAYVRIPSFGSLITSVTVLDIYDKDDSTQIGTIEGTFFTFSPAKFYFYDEKGTARGIAYMDSDKSSFTIFHPKNSKKIIASLNRIFIRNETDRWVIDIIDPEAIDPRLLISFGAFALDTQSDFVPDN